jgi:hypothetical protein
MYLFPCERFAKDDINHTACIEFAVLHRSCVNHNSDEWGPVRETAVNETQLSCEHHHTDSMEKHNHRSADSGRQCMDRPNFEVDLWVPTGGRGRESKVELLGKSV